MSVRVGQCVSMVGFILILFHHSHDHRLDMTLDVDESLRNDTNITKHLREMLVISSRETLVSFRQACVASVGSRQACVASWFEAGMCGLLVRGRHM